jgi:hypothetical protein
MDYMKRNSLIALIEQNEWRVINSIQTHRELPPIDRALDEPKPVPTEACHSPIQSKSPAKKDLKLVQSSLENPLSSYMSSRRSFTVESPHFGQFREPSTPQSLSKQPFQQHQLETSQRVAHHLHSIAAEGFVLGEDSKFTFQGPNHDSNSRQELRFDSFQQAPVSKKHGNIQILTTFNRQPREQSQDEDTKRDDPMAQQSTSEPKSTDFGASRDEDEDLEQLIASVSRRVAKRGNVTGSNLLSSESNSHHASTETNSHFSERVPLAPKMVNREIKDCLSSSQVVMRPVPFNYQTRDGQNIFKDSTNDLGQPSAEFGVLARAELWSPEVSGSPTSRQKPEMRISHLCKKTQEENTKEKDSKLIDYEDHLSKGFKRKCIGNKTFKENQIPSGSLRIGPQPIEINLAVKGRSGSKKKKSQDVMVDRSRSKLHMEVMASRELNGSRLPTAGDMTPRQGSAKKSKTTSQIPLFLDISSSARSPKHPQNFVTGMTTAKSVNKLAPLKERLANGVALMRSPTGDKSFNATSFLKTLQQTALKSSNKSQTPLSKKELKKFMEKRKFTSTVVAESNASLTSRSAVKLKSKRKLATEMTERSTIGRPKTPDHKTNQLRASGHLQQSDAMVCSHGLRESRENAGSYLGELLHERGTARSTLRASGELKMGEVEKARLRQMGDRHLELSKCLTSRAKPSLEIPLENSFVRNRVEHLRKCENTPERLRTQYREQNQELGQRKVFDREGTHDQKSRLDSTLHKSGELTRKGGNLRIDIGSLSSKVLATIPFDS